MNTESVIKNRLDGNDYRVSIAQVHKRASVPNPLGLPGLPKLDFNNIILEAAIFRKKGFIKPLFIIALNDGYTDQMPKKEFSEFVQKIIVNEKIEDLMNGLLDTYKKYGVYATECDMWQLLLLSKLRIVFIYKDPRRD